MSGRVEHHERYKPRGVQDLGTWDAGPLTLKVYGLLAEGREVDAALLREAWAFVEADVPPLAASEGESNDLGFVVIHPGDLGVSILAHWWMQGSVLCQRIRRVSWGSDTPMDTQSRPVIACVWELALIDAERRIWRETMMGDAPDPEAYLARRADATAV